jgi:hypothetical protein
VTAIAPIAGNRVTHHRVMLNGTDPSVRTVFIAQGDGDPVWLGGASLKVGDRVDFSVTSFAYVTEARRGGQVILRNENERLSLQRRTFFPGLIATILTLAAMVLGVLTFYWQDLKAHIKPIAV